MHPPTAAPVTGGGGWADNKPISVSQQRNGDKTARGWAKGGAEACCPPPPVFPKEELRNSGHRYGTHARSPTPVHHLFQRGMSSVDRGPSIPPLPSREGAYAEEPSLIFPPRRVVYGVSPVRHPVCGVISQRIPTPP